MLKVIPSVIGCLGLIAATAMANEQLKTQEQKAGYIIGFQMAKQMIQSKDNIDLDALKLGMQDVFAGSKPKLSNDEMRQAMTAFQNIKKEREQLLLNKAKEIGNAYLEENKKKISLEEKNQISHRAIAIRKFADKIKQLMYA